MSCVSVIVPIYNQQNYLRQCIESILEQTFRDLEILLIDDGSTDLSGSICDAYAATDARIKVIHKENGGLSDARNAGLDRCCGQYILFVDADDFVAENMIEKLMSAIERESADIAVCDCYLVDQDGNLLEKQNKGILDVVYTGEEILRFKEEILPEESWLMTVAWNKLYHRNLFLQIRFPKGKVHEDEYIFHEIYTKTALVSCISDKLYYYRRHAGTITANRAAASVLDRMEALCRRSFRYFELNYMEMIRRFEKVVYSNLKVLVMQSGLSAVQRERRNAVLKQCRNLILEMYRRKLITIAVCIWRMCAYTFPTVMLRGQNIFSRIGNKLKCRNWRK